MTNVRAMRIKQGFAMTNVRAVRIMTNVRAVRVMTNVRAVRIQRCFVFCCAAARDAGTSCANNAGCGIGTVCDVGDVCREYIIFIIHIHWTLGSAQLQSFLVRLWIWFLKKKKFKIFFKFN